MNSNLKSSVIAIVASLGIAGSAAAQSSCGVIVLFDTGQSSVGPATASSLANFVAANPDASLSVTGYTDAVGSATVNRALSQRRAQMVAATLNNSSASVVSVTGAGEAARPDTTGPNDPRNRRVEVVDTSCEGGLFAAAPVATGAGAAGALAGSTGLAVAAGVGGLALLAAAAGDGDSSGDTPGGTQ